MAVLAPGAVCHDDDRLGPLRADLREALRQQGRALYHTAQSCLKLHMFAVHVIAVGSKAADAIHYLRNYDKGTRPHQRQRLQVHRRLAVLSVLALSMPPHKSG